MNGFFSDVSEISKFINEEKISLLAFATVAGNRLELIELCELKSIEWYEAIVKPQFYGLTVAYKNPGKLGVDRWLAMLGTCCSGLEGGTVVVDSGTALKIDVIDSAGHHLGGSISPGLTLSFSALNRNTAQLPEVRKDFNGHIGITTEDCIAYGVIMSAISLIERTIADLEMKCCVILTGGDANILSKHLKIDHKVKSNITLDGLRLLVDHDFKNIEENK
jgi:type III pantothenate kinase